jgi:O-succinylbenzoic acid--CoA ligase
MFEIDFNKTPEELQLLIQQHLNKDIFEQLPVWQKNIWSFLATWVNENNQLFEINTSGSTGTPKTIAHKRASMIASAQRTCDFFSLQENDTALLALPVTHIGGRMMLVRSKVRKLRLICIEPKANPLLGFSSTLKIDFAAFTPMQLFRILEDDDTAAYLENFQTIILGGGEISELLKTKIQTIAASVYETYGMTETVSHIALKKVNGADQTNHFSCLGGIEIATDNRGCLIVKAAALLDEILVTNDLVHLIDQQHFEWLGRIDNTINTGGIKIQAEEIERKLKSFVENRFFITSEKDAQLGERVILVLEQNELTSIEKEKLQALFTTHLSAYEKPKAMYHTPTFTETENGKINRKATLVNAIK